jgi:hypothetical protein
MHSYQRVAVKGQLDVVKPVFKIRHKQAEDRQLSEGRQAQWILFSPTLVVRVLYSW